MRSSLLRNPKVQLLSLATVLIFIYVVLWNNNASFIWTKPIFVLADVSSDIAALQKLISSKMEYPPRKVPEREELLKIDPHLSSLIGRQFLPGIKSPCWYEEFSSELDLEPYNITYWNQNQKLRSLLSAMKADFKEYLHYSGGKQFRLRCMPYFYIIGQTKCGTTDLYRRLLEHPQFQYNVQKEPHWWNRNRFEPGYSDDIGNVPVEGYLDLFDWAARHIEIGLREGPSPNNNGLKIVTGDASAATMWANMENDLENNTREDGPYMLTVDAIHTVQPDAKFIAILRDPVERLYSAYLYFNDYNNTAEDFHERVLETISRFKACLTTSSLRRCAYSNNYNGPKTVRIQVGMYVVYLLDWLTVVDENNIMILRLEDYSANLNESLHRVFSFLDVDPPSKELEERIVERDKANDQEEKHGSVGSMLPVTRLILKEFYRPFNRKLASVLKNEGFLWD